MKCQHLKRHSREMAYICYFEKAVTDFGLKVVIAT